MLVNTSLNFGDKQSLRVVILYAQLMEKPLQIVLKLMVWGNIVTSLFSVFATKFCFFVNISIKLLSYRYMYI